MADVEKICDTVGRNVIAKHLGVGGTAISNALDKGVFPARWFVVMAALCKDAGVDCPFEAFSFAELALNFGEVPTRETMKVEGNGVSDV
jgi:hypothetical protein